MTTPLARWLTEHRPELLERWAAHAPDRAGGAPRPAPAEDDEGQLRAGAPVVVAHPDEMSVTLTSLFDGFVAAADGDAAPLDEALHTLRALRTSPGEEDLPRNLQLLSRLRRAAWQMLSGSAPNGTRPPDDWRTIGDALDDLADSASATLTNHWVERAATTASELHETRLLVESLYRDAEATDRTTMHVSQLNEISQGLSASLDQQQQLAVVGSQLKSTLQVGSLSLWRQDGDSLRAVHILDDAFDGAAPEWAVPAGQAGDIVARAFASGEMVVDPSPDPAAQGSWYHPGHAVLAVPLSARGRTGGIILFQDAGGALLLDRTEQEFVRSAAGQAAIAFENARLYGEVRSFNAVLEERIAARTHELQIERDTLETLNTIALDISSTLDENLLMQNSLAAVASLVDASHGSISLLDRETDQLVDSAVLGRTENVGYTRFPIGRGIIGWVAQHRRGALVADVSADPRWVELPDDGEVTEAGPKKRGGSMIAVPLVAHHELQGVLVLSHDTVGYFTQNHLRLAEAAANQLATGIHNALMYKQVEQDLLRRYEMQQAQEQAISQSNAILQSLSDGVIVCDSFGSVITVNPAAERILERPLEELLIWNMPELFRRLMGRRADELPIEDVLNQPVTEAGDPHVYSATCQIGVRMVSVTLNPVLSTEKQHPMGALAVFRDITREVESDRLKTEFIGTVSHELRTPMTSIKGFTQLLVMGSLGPVNETQREFLNIIQNNAERMIAIINDLLDITKIETGSVELDLRPLHMAEALSGVMMELQPKIVERGHELAISIPPGLPLVKVDHRRFNQILLNLLSNAVKYTPRSGQISLEAREVGLEAIPERQREGMVSRRYVQVDVRDTGVGIAPEEIDRIFERFYRTENPLKVEAGGTGLGLSLVRPLVQLFGGRMWVTSKPGEGSTFSFVIPAV